MQSMYDALNGVKGSWTTINDIGDINPSSVNPDEFRSLTLQPYLPKCNLNLPSLRCKKFWVYEKQTLKIQISALNPNLISVAVTSSRPGAPATFLNPGLLMHSIGYTRGYEDAKWKNSTEDWIKSIYYKYKLWTALGPIMFAADDKRFMSITTDKKIFMLDSKVKYWNCAPLS